MSFLDIGTNITNWFGVSYHIVGFVLIFVSLAILVVRGQLAKKPSEKYGQNTDIALKFASLFVMLVACILSVL